MDNESLNNVNYLRISVTDRCNFKCFYCMPEEGIIYKNPKEILSFEEILTIVKLLCDLGIKRVRLTGGEPLLRRGIVNLVNMLSKIEQLDDVSLTTNGYLLSKYIHQLKDAGLNRINISVDSLNPIKFERISGGNYLNDVLKSIELTRKEGVDLKINTVILKGINDDEIFDFIEFSLKNNLIVRFIEFIPVTPLWNKEFYLPIEKIKQICEKKYKLIPISLNYGAGPAQYYNVNDIGIIGFIDTNLHNCRKCSRLRLSSSGELKRCLYEKEGINLQTPLRNKNYDKIIYLLKKAISSKKEISFNSFSQKKIYMCTIGG